MSNSRLFDVHTHTQFHAYEKDSVDVIRRALDKNIWIVNVGTQKDTSAEAVRVANEYPEGVYATVGLHPIHTEASYHDAQELGEDNKEQGISNKGFVSRGEEFDYDYYKNLAQDKKVMAIGECGIDCYRLNQKSNIKNQKEKQQEVFIQHIKLAVDIKKPLMIHCRDAFSELIGILENRKSEITNLKYPGIIHFFSGSSGDAKKLLELGFSFSFGGVITFTGDYDKQVKYIPLDKILLETDAPYVAPIPHRGKRNEPAYLEEVAKRLAVLKNTSLQEVGEVTVKNALQIFNISF